MCCFIGSIFHVWSQAINNIFLWNDDIRVSERTLSTLKTEKTLPTFEMFNGFLSDISLRHFTLKLFIKKYETEKSNKWEQLLFLSFPGKSISPLISPESFVNTWTGVNEALVGKKIGRKAAWPTFKCQSVSTWPGKANQASRKKTVGGLNGFGPGVMNGFTPK